MTWFDYTLMILIAAAAFWIIFKSLYKEGTIQCPGCDNGSCSIKQIHNKPQS